MASFIIDQLGQIENEDLAARVIFSSDLYYRLNVFPIHIAPLRQRPDDVPLLVNHFLAIFSTKMTKSIKGVSKKDMERFRNYAWPGNVRELMQVIERAVILTDQGRLKVPPWTWQWPMRAPTRASASLS